MDINCNKIMCIPENTKLEELILANRIRSENIERIMRLVLKKIYMNNEFYKSDWQSIEKQTRYYIEKNYEQICKVSYVNLGIFYLATDFASAAFCEEFIPLVWDNMEFDGKKVNFNERAWVLVSINKNYTVLKLFYFEPSVYEKKLKHK
ncbi:MAG: hypothetical protein RSB67_00910 [Clostridia bacterium]